MSTKLSIFLTLDKSAAQVQAAIAKDQSLKYEQLQAITNLMQGLKAGASAAVVQLDIGGDAATGSITLSSAATGSSATIEGHEVAIEDSGTDDEKALALAEAINATEELKALVLASASSNVVSLQSAMPGELANEITLAVSGSGVTRSAATLAGGAAGETRLLKFNL